jgi:predicted enzyme related to lactoylglutathione lyase
MADFRGRFLWYDCMTPDLERAKSFYTAVAGWGIEVWNSGDHPYSMWTVGGRPVGGLMKLPPDAPAPPHWMGYIGTPDVDATTARAEALGAKIFVTPTEIPTVGKFSVMADPYGAMFAAFTPYPPAGGAPEYPAAPAVGDVSWHELITTDIAGALGFYGELFGWTADTAMDMGPAGIYQMYKAGEKQLGGIYLAPKQMPAPPSFLYYVRVADLEAAMEKAKAGGGQVVMGPHEVPGGDRIAVCLDPMGAAFALVWMKALSQA